ncbi:MAG TPA: hypothetical protein PK398_00890 [Candidatus Gracilibacteria bacterium]|nr:hypothetical protein [Candidatus Gracilibacteria bacterium]
MNEAERKKKVELRSQIILLNDLYRKFDRQTADNVSFDSKMGIILGFFALYFVGILTQTIENPLILSNILFLIGAIAGLIAVLILIAAFYPVDYKDPGRIKSFYDEQNFEKSKAEIRKDLIKAHKEAYETNAVWLSRKAKLCKAGLIAFMISIASLFIFIIHSNMNPYQNFGGDDDQSSRCDIVTKGEDTTSSGGAENEGNCDIKTLGAE